MGQSFNVLFCTLTIVIFIGCSKSMGGGGNQGGPKPKNKEEALAKLSSNHRQNFESWTQSILKSCDASAAFGLGKGLRNEGVDGAALIQKNGGSVIFSDNGNLAVITSYHSLSGTATSKVEKSEDINGQIYSVSAEAKREGSTCSVYLFGQKVYETYIAESFIVGAHWAPGNQTPVTSAIPQVKTLGSSGMSEVVNHGIFSLISQTLRPSQQAITLISKKLGLKEDDGIKFFKLSNYPYTDSAIKIANEPSSIWSNQEGGNLIAQANVLEKAFDGSTRTLPLEVRLAVPDFSFGEIINSADNGNLKLAIDVKISKSNMNFNYSASTVELHGLAPFDKDEAVECTKDRAMAYVGHSASSNQIVPSVQVMFSPCRTLYEEIEKASYENGLMKLLIPEMFAGVSPSTMVQYGGWDQVLSALALEVLEQGKDIRDELDPSSRTRVVGIVSNHLEALNQEIGRLKSIGTSKSAVLQMGLDWSFNGQVVSTARIAEILQAIDNSIDTFKGSSERLLLDLSHRPNSYDDQLRFAQGIDEAYKAEAMKALGLSRDLNYPDFERDVFNQVIQKKIAVDEFKDWSVKFTSIKTEIGKYSITGAVKGELVGLSIKWLKSGEATLQDLDPVYSAINNSLVPFEESTRELVRSLSQSLQTQKEALDFARSLTPEYKKLAIAIKDNSKAAEYESWGESFFKSVLQKRPSLEQLTSWNELWIAALAFTQRELARTKDEFGSTNEWNRKKVLEVAVKETWSTADFVGLETIAEVARAKNTCDRHKGYSSLADCAGMSLFSKQKEMFLDPAWGGRYVTLSREFANYMQQLQGFDWTTLRWKLVGEFFGSFGPIWSKCDQGAFSQKAASLKAQINSITRESDQIKKWEIERQINETVSNCH